MEAKIKKTRVQVIITEPQKRFLDELAVQEGLSVSAIIRDMVENYRKRVLENQLKEAAKSLYSEYENNEELTDFTSLDGEDFS